MRSVKLPSGVIVLLGEGGNIAVSGSNVVFTFAAGSTFTHTAASAGDAQLIHDKITAYLSSGGPGSDFIEISLPAAVSTASIDSTNFVLGQTRVLTGAGYQDGAQVTIGPLSGGCVGPTAYAIAQAVLSVGGGTSLSFVVPNAPPGTYDVVVTNPDGGVATLAASAIYP